MFEIYNHYGIIGESTKQRIREGTAASIESYFKLRLLFAAEFQSLIKEQKNRYRKIDKEKRGDMALPEYLEKESHTLFARRVEAERDELIDKWHNDEVYYIIYESGLTRHLSARDIISGKVQRVNINKWAFTLIITPLWVYDTEIGPHPWDLSNEADAGDQQQHLLNMEIKYNTSAGRKRRAEYKELPIYGTSRVFEWPEHWPELKGGDGE